MRLRYTVPALDDLTEILDYIAAHSPQGAKRVQSRLRSAIDLLLQYPFIGARTDDPDIRRLVVTPFPYLVFIKSRPRPSSSMPFATPRGIPPACRDRPRNLEGKWKMSQNRSALDRAGVTAGLALEKGAAQRAVADVIIGSDDAES